MSLLVYKLLHILGLLLLFLSLGAACWSALVSSGETSGKGRKCVNITHGIGLLLLVVTGFGMLAKLEMGSPATWGGWVWLKLVIWLFFGAAPVLVRKFPNAAWWLWMGFPLLGFLAAYLALAKPF